jgi:3-hydroxybutyrate dehydrogenase
MNLTEHVEITYTVTLDQEELVLLMRGLAYGIMSRTTPLVDKQIADQAKAHNISPEQVVRDVMLSHQAIKQFVQVEELAALAVFLASDAASSMTGTAIAMDGGWTLH